MSYENFSFKKCPQYSIVRVRPGTSLIKIEIYDSMKRRLREKKLRIWPITAVCVPHASIWLML